MGIGIGDYKLDGTLGILKTHFADDTSVLYENNGKGEFTDVTLKSGLGVETRFVCWGAGIVDLDNDGLPDLFIAAGQVYPELEKKAALFPYKNPRIVFRNLGNGSIRRVVRRGRARDRCSALSPGDALSATSITMATWTS